MIPEVEKKQLMGLQHFTKRAISDSQTGDEGSD
jgi:hypothetical protein